MSRPVCGACGELDVTSDPCRCHPPAPLDRAVEEAKRAMGEYETLCPMGVRTGSRLYGALRSLLAALDADRGEAEAALREISAECTEPPFMGDGSLVSARRIKGMCDRYFARREGAAVRGEAGGPNA